MIAVVIGIRAIATLSASEDGGFVPCSSSFDGGAFDTPKGGPAPEH